MGLSLHIHSIAVVSHEGVFAMLKVHADEGLLLAIAKEFQEMYILVSSYSSTGHFYGRRLYSPLRTSNLRSVYWVDI